MAKRRSSTRVGRKHPAPSVLQRRLADVQDPPPPPQCSPPFVVDGLICRTMNNTNAQMEIQEWAGTYWQPSMVPMYRLATRTAAPRDLLEARRVPREDWEGQPPRRWEAPQLIRLSGDGFASDGPEVGAPATTRPLV